MTMARMAGLQRRPGRRMSAGVAALELALLLPVLVLLPAAAWDLGRAVQQAERLHQTVRAAARHLASGDAADPARQSEARQLAVYGRVAASGGSEGLNPVVPGLQLSMVDILEPSSHPGVRLVATSAGPVSLVTVEIRGLRFEPLLLPAWAGFTFRPVSLTLAYRFT